MCEHHSFLRRMAASFVAVALVLASLPRPALADASRVVTIGADLTAEQRANVLSFFGLSEADLQNLTVVNVTNADERSHLSSSIDLGVIGNKTYSCSYIEPTRSGGIYVQTANLNYVTSYMLYNALQTAGVRNCNLVVTAPFPVSGTGALTGVFMAYESQGQNLDDAKERAATEELVATAELTETYGEDVAEVISEVKDEVISDSAQLDNNQIMDIVRSVAASRGIELSDEDATRIMEFVRQLQDLGYDQDTFGSTLADFEGKLNEVTAAAQEQGGGVLEAIGGFFQSIIDWFQGLFGGGTPTDEEISQGAEEFFQNFNTDVFQFDDPQQQGEAQGETQGEAQVETQGDTQVEAQGEAQGETQQ